MPNASFEALGSMLDQAITAVRALLTPPARLSEARQQVAAVTALIRAATAFERLRILINTPRKASARARRAPAKDETDMHDRHPAAPAEPSREPAAESAAEPLDPAEAARVEALRADIEHQLERITGRRESRSHPGGVERIPVGWNSGQLARTGDARAASSGNG